MTADNRQQRTEFLILLLLGGIFLVIGVVLAVLFGYLYSGRAAQVEQMQPLSAADLRNSPVGRTVLVEGQLSRRNEARFQGFVAYRCLEYRGQEMDSRSSRSNRECWAEIERVTPPLRLDVGGEPVQIGNDDYTLQGTTIGSQGAPVEWQDRAELVWDPQVQVGTRRCYGYRVGSPVLALGQVAAGTAGPALRAEWVYGGSRADYLASQRSAVTLLVVIGGVFALIGTGLIALAFWQRRPAAPLRLGRKHRASRKRQ